jgi:uncharacterized protein (UPF0335 family)
MKYENHGTIDNSQLLSIIERIEKLNEEVDSVSADVKEIFNEAKSAGFDPKYIKMLVKLRKLDSDEISERDELTKMYRTAIGL